MERIKHFSRVTFSSLRIKNFRLFFINQSLSQTGMWMQTVALGWLALLVTGSGTQLGLVIALQHLPMLILGPWGGVLVDQYDKRKLLIATQLTYGLLMIFVAAAMFFGFINLTLLYLYAGVFGLIRLLDTPARQTYVSELVEPTDLKNAVSLNSTVNNLARAVGPSIAGPLIALTSTEICFLFTGVSYLLAVFTLTTLKSVHKEVARLKNSVMEEIMGGFRYVRENPLIKNTLIAIAIVGTFGMEFQVTLPIFARETFKGGAEVYALLMSAMGVGAVIGGLFAAGRHKISRKNLNFFILCFGLSMVLVSAAPNIFLAASGMLVVGFFAINVNSLANTMLQLETAPNMRGRVMALFIMATAGSTPVGGPIVGFVSEIFGGRAGILLGGAAVLLSALFLVFLIKQTTEENVFVESKEPVPGEEEAVI